MVGWINGGKVVTLTFDDGPGPYTGRILDILAAHHIRATFCQIGEQVGDFPAIERRIVAAGDTLCNHTWDHDEDLAARPLAKIDSEIDRTQAAIKSSCGVTPAFFRAPGGFWGSTPAFRTELARKALVPLGWAADSEDWKKPGVATIVHNVMSEVSPGAVILLHDAGGDRSETVAALPILISKLQQAGYRFVAMPPAADL